MKRFFRALVLSTAMTIPAHSTTLLHSGPGAASPPSVAESAALTRWKATVRDRGNGELLAGLDSDDFEEREASSFETHRRVLDGALPVRELMAAWPDGAHLEVRRRILDVVEKAMDEERILTALVKLAAAPDTTAAMRRHVTDILDGTAAMEWKQLVTRLRDAVERKTPSSEVVVGMLEKILRAIPEKSRKAMAGQGAAVVTGEVLAAAAALGLSAKERPLEKGPKSASASIALRDPKDTTGLTYVLEIMPAGDLRLRPHVALTRKDIAPTTLKLPSGEWSWTGLPDSAPIETTRTAVADAGAESAGVRLEKSLEVTPEEYRWLQKVFPEQTEAIMEAFGIHFF